MPDVTPGQAQYVIHRLIDERRISEAEVRRYVAEIGNEIATIERRLASLRGSAGNPPLTEPSPRRAPRTPKTVKPRGKKGHPRGIAGTLAVLLRSIPAAEHPALAAIRADKGIKAAITAAKAAAKKA